MHRLFLVATCLVGLFLLTSVWAAKPNDTEATRYKNEADMLTKQVEQMQANLDKMPTDVKTAAQDVLDALKNKAAAATKLSAAKTSGEDAALTTANADYAKANLLYNQAQDRFNLRNQLAFLQPSESQLTQWKANPNETLKPLVAAAVDAKKKVTDNGNALLAAIKPEATPADLDTARDAFQQSQDELDLANRTVNYAINRQQLSQRAGTNADVIAKVEALAKADADYLAALKLAKEQAFKARLLERKRNAANTEAGSAIGTTAPRPRQ